MGTVTALVRKADGAIITDGSATEDGAHVRLPMPRSPDEKRERWDFVRKTLRTATREEIAATDTAVVTTRVEWMLDSNQAMTALRDAVADALKIDRADLRAAHAARLSELPR